MFQSATASIIRQPGWRRWTLPLLICGVLALVAIQNAWVSEDAYITFRTIDNLLNGHGLRWNIVERVQSYTHPLWLLLLAPFSVLPGSPYYTSIVVSVVLTFAASMVLCMKIARENLGAVAGVVLLISSKAFVDYSTSGLENPLTHLLLAVFFAVYLHDESTGRSLFFLSGIAALGALNRMDSLLLFVPALFFASAGVSFKKSIVPVALGFLPFLIWEVFSLFYYGFLFPNTAYAKLSTGIGSRALMEQGIEYIRDALFRDPVTLTCILTGFMMTLAARQNRHLMLPAGILLYLFYVISVGGDFMAGRFLAAPFLCAVIAVVASPFLKIRWLSLLVVSAGLLSSILAPFPPIKTNARYGSLRRQWIEPTGICDERGFYFNTCGLLNSGHYSEMPAHPWVTLGKKLRWLKEPVVISRNVGFQGFYAGSGVYMVDTLALSDPLLARLPAVQRKSTMWRVGHYDRQIPEGYIESLRTGRNVIADRNLAAYYEKLALIIRGNPLDLKRLVEIWKFNTGCYGDLLQSYINRLPKRVSLSDIQAKDASGEPGVWDLPSSGLEIDCGKILKGGSLDICLSAENDDSLARYSRGAYLPGYLIQYCHGDLGIDSEWLQAIPSQKNCKHFSIKTPPFAEKAGFDRVRIYPLLGLRSYFIGHLELRPVDHY